MRGFFRQDEHDGQEGGRRFPILFLLSAYRPWLQIRDPVPFAVGLQFRAQ